MIWEALWKKKGYGSRKTHNMVLQTENLGKPNDSKIVAQIFGQKPDSKI